MLSKYEIVFIINPSLEDKKTTIDKVMDLINTSGKVENVDEWGNRKLAYEIDKNTEGYYVLMNFDANPQFIDELERVLKITTEIIKFIVIKKEN